MNEKHNSLLIKWIKSPTGIVSMVSLLIVGYFLFKEHRAHITGAMPYILLGLFLVFHFFMHSMHGHGSHSHKNGNNGNAEHSHDNKHRGG